ncbi:MAG: SDR family NAD(P)-dependent oxidoreductase, partial [Planctomycetales bacterium]|nr:SDR family NAD(P)-dependent oxidoreductase [Planctomycetales bacterium]
EVRELLGDELDLAAINGPSMCLVAGMNEAIDKLSAQLAEREVECRKLHVAGASHCRLLDPILAEFRAAISAIRLNAPQLPFISNVTGTWATAEDVTDPEYWVRHFRQPVRFADGLAEILKDNNRILLEVGPGQTLGSLSRQQPTKPAAVFASIPHPDDPTPDDRYLRESVGRVWMAGYDVDWTRVRGNRRQVRLSLPTYPFERQRYWIEPGKPLAAAENAHVSLGKRAELDQWFYTPSWQPAPLPPRSPAASDSRNWLVFLDTAGVGREVASRLSAQGHHVVAVREADAFYRFSEHEYAITPEAGREHYSLLFGELAAAGRLPDCILHLPLLTERETFRPGSSFYHHNQERGFYSLLYLAQALGEHDLPESVELWTVSNGMYAVSGQPVCYPEKATALGPLRVIPHEMPQVHCHHIDFEVVTAKEAQKSHLPPCDTLVSHVLDELGCSPDRATTTCVIAYRNNQRYLQQFNPVELPAKAQDATPAFRQGGTYLVTGGLGGIGMIVAEHLSQQYQANLILMGRTGLPPEDEWEAWLSTHAEQNAVSQRIRKLQSLEANGSRLQVAAADVANIEQMQRVVQTARDSFGTIHGVIHVAGLLEDGVIQTKTPDQVERVFSSKVHGTQLLLELFRAEPLDFFALFSSSSALLGPPGQVDYAAANAFLDAVAQSTLPHNFPVFAINWGLWKEVGKGIQISQKMRGEEVENAHLHEYAKHPLLDEFLEHDADRVVYSSRFRTDRWVLNEHRMSGGHAVLPGTGYLELVRGAFAEVTHADRLEQFDVTFLSPLKVDDDEEREIRVIINREGGAFDFSVISRNKTSAAAEWHEHAEGCIRSLRNDTSPPPEKLDIAAVRARCQREEHAAAGSALQTKQAQLVKFGPRWSCLRSVHWGQREAIATIELSAEYANELDGYRIHPAMLDLATGYALPLIDGYDQADVLFVPMSYERIRIYGALPATVVSHVRTTADSHVSKETASFDVTIADTDGNVLVEVHSLTVKRLASTAGFDFDRADQQSTSSARQSSLSAGERLFLQTFESGICATEGMQVLERVLAQRTHRQVIASPLNFNAWLAKTDEAARAASDSGVKFERPVLASSFEAPRDELERQLAAIWGDLLGVDEIGIHDDFFELGGHSLIAVRLFARIKKTWHVEYPISVLFEAPTIAKCAEMLKRELGDNDLSTGVATQDETSGSRSFRYLVPLNTVSNPVKPPFFLVAGMFGNVLNLRHLGAHLGKDQPVYALQARGLYGDDKPHETFEEAAADYLQEIRAIQPHGPYFLGGFSGGGISAYEIAQQLVAQGETVGMLVMLDSIPAQTPQPNWTDRLHIQLHHLRREGFHYFTNWAKRRWEWEQRKRNPVTHDLTPAEFRSDQIEAAFRRACARYQTKPYAGKVHLFRPPFDAYYCLPHNRVLNRDRGIMDHHNHWVPYVQGGIDVHLVTGDHDSMVLEPHVRVMAEKLRSCLEDAQTAGHGDRVGSGEELQDVESYSLAAHR